MNFYNLVSFLGLFIFLFLVWALSENRRQVNYTTVLTGLGIMLLFAFFIFLFPFGPLALPPGVSDAGGAKSLGFILAFQVFPVIIFFSAIMSVLYFYGVMQKVIKVFS